VGQRSVIHKALELDSSDATVHQWFSKMLSGLSSRTQEAIDEDNRKNRIDSTTGPVVTNYGPEPVTTSCWWINVVGLNSRP
jgi:hypothetical protein